MYDSHLRETEEVMNFFLVTMAVIFLALLVSKIRATKLQLKYWYLNPLADPDFANYLQENGPKKTLQWNQSRLLVWKSQVPICGLGLVVITWLLGVELLGQNVMTFLCCVIIALAIWQSISVWLNWRTALLLRRTMPTLSSRTRNALEAEEREKQAEAAKKDKLQKTDS